MHLLANEGNAEVRYFVHLPRVPCAIARVLWYTMHAQYRLY